MTDQGNDVGLITKTLEKVEKEETPPVQPEIPPESGGKNTSGKKKLLIAASALVILICLGAGYMFFLKPTAESPAEMPRRSISARKKPGKPAQKPEEGKEDASQPTSDPSGQKDASAPSASEPGTTVEPVIEMEAASGSVPEALPTEQEDLTQVNAKQAPPDQEETQISTLPAEEPGTEEELAVPENEEQTYTQAASGEDQGTLPEEHMEDETLLIPSEESFSEETTPTYTSEPENEWTETTVEVTERSVSRAERYCKKGTSYQQQGKIEEAIESYREALNFDPDHLPAHMKLATAYLQTSRFREAEQELAFLYAVKPKDPKMLFNFGLLLYRTGEYVSAEAKVRKLLEEDPFHLEANLLLASIYEERGGINKALELCKKAYQINSAHPRVLYRLGRAWDMVGEPAEAAKYYRLFLSTRSQKESQLELAVRDRLNYILSQKEEP